MATSERATRRPLRRILRVVLAVAGGVVILLLVAVIVVQATGVPGRLRDRLLATVSDQLGREVTAGDVGVSVFPRLAVRVENVSVEGLGERPLVSLGRVDLRVAFWPLLRSLGEEVRVTSLEIVSPRLTLLRTEEAEWDHELVLREWESETEREVVLDWLRVRDGELWVEDRLAGGEAALVASGLALDARGVGPGLPLRVRATAVEPGLSAELDIAPLPTRVIGLAPQQWPEIRGRLAVDGLLVHSLRGLMPPGVASTIAGGRLHLDAEIDTTEQRNYVLHGQARLEDLLLREEPAHGRLQLTASMPAGRWQALRLEITESSFQGPGLDLGMTALVDGLEPARLQVAVDGELLSLDALVGASPEAAPETDATGGESLVPAEWRKAFQRARAQAEVELQRVTRGRLEMTDVRASAALVDGVFTLQRGDAALYDGSVSLGGTRIDLNEEVPQWQFVGRLTDVSLERAFEELSGAAVATGRLSGRMDLSGQGAEWEAVRENLNGSGTVSIAEGTLARIDLRSTLESAFTRALRGDAEDPSRVEGSTTMEDLSASFTIRDGQLHFDRPLTVATPFATGTLEGRIGLDMALDLDGSLLVDPEVISGATGGRWSPRAPVAVPVNIGGTLESPAASFDAIGALRGLVSPVDPDVRRRARDRVLDEARERLRF